MVERRNIRNFGNFFLLHKDMTESMSRGIQYKPRTFNCLLSRTQGRTRAFFSKQIRFAINPIIFDTVRATRTSTLKPLFLVLHVIAICNFTNN